MNRAVATTLPRSLYSRASLTHAAAVVAGARVGLAAKGKRWEISVEPAALFAEVLNEALSHSRRQARLREVRQAVTAVVARLLGGFSTAAADPLEQLEPQVRLDRAEETALLFERVKRET